MIFDIVPFRSDKNIGRAYNERIEVLPDDSIVVLRDGDCMYLTPDYGRLIENIYDSNKDTYRVFTCITNRVGIPELCYNNEFSNDFSIDYHQSIAEDVKIAYGDKVEPTKIVAGYFMMFHKSLWIEYGGFPENNLGCDMDLSLWCNENGILMGKALGLYVFHSYRIPETDQLKARSSYKHLL